jgi:hypothetical protein
MKRLDPTDIITAAHIEAILQDIAIADLGAPPPISRKVQTGSAKTRQPRDELSPGFRRVHVEPNGIEREPKDGEPYMIVERVSNKGGDKDGYSGGFETTIMPYSFDGRTRYVLRHGGPWEITEISDNGNWVTWIRLARGVRP